MNAIEVPKFGGLQVSADPQEAGFLGAIDCLNVLVDRDGRLRTRDGYDNIVTDAIPSAGYILGVFEVAVDGARCFLATYRTNSGDIGGLIYTSAGASLGGGTFNTVPAGQHTWATQFGSDTAQYVFFTTSTGDDLFSIDLSDYSLDTWSGYGGGPLAVTQNDNRLVTAFGWRVLFSDPGDPGTFGANNFVDLTPGDEENIVEIVTRGQDTFVFKDTKFYVFYSTSVDGAGEPIFNYRTVDTGQGAGSPGAAVAAPEGVYFANAGGVWLTAGGEPKRLSGPVAELFNGTSLPYTTSAVTNITSTATIYKLGLYRRQLVLATGAGMLMMDRDTGQWTAHSIAATSLCGFDKDRHMLFSLASDNDVYKLSSSYTDDNGSAISSRWRTGFWNPGGPGSESVVREFLVDGSGTVTFKAAVNDGVSLSTGQSVVLGTAPAITQGRSRRDGNVRGRNVSFELSAASGVWQVSRVTANVLGSSRPGVKSE